MHDIVISQHDICIKLIMVLLMVKLKWVLSLSEWQVTEVMLTKICSLYGIPSNTTFDAFAVYFTGCWFWPSEIFMQYVSTLSCGEFHVTVTLEAVLLYVLSLKVILLGLLGVPKLIDMQLWHSQHPGKSLSTTAHTSNPKCVCLYCSSFAFDHGIVK